MVLRRDGPYFDYLIAVAALAAASLLRALLDPLLGEQLPLITYFLAVIAVACCARLLPAVLTMLAGPLLGFILFSRHWATQVELVADITRYVIVTVAVIAAFASMQAAQRRASRQEALLEGTTRALKEGERRFRTLIDQIQEYAIFLTDLEGRATT